MGQSYLTTHLFQNVQNTQLFTSKTMRTAMEVAVAIKINNKKVVTKPKLAHTC